MAKGNVLLKITGILLILFGILGIGWAMWYGFLGAYGMSEMKKEVITGLLIFYGLYGFLAGFFQIAVGSVAFRHSNKPERAVRCIVWGGIILLLGIGLFVILQVTSGMIHPDSSFYPAWYGKAIVIISGMVLPALMILGGILNKLSAGSVGAKAGGESANELA